MVWLWLLFLLSLPLRSALGNPQPQPSPHNITEVHYSKNAATDDGFGSARSSFTYERRLQPQEDYIQHQSAPSRRIENGDSRQHHRIDEPVAVPQVGWTNGHTPGNGKRQEEVGWTNGHTPSNSKRQEDASWTNGHTPANGKRQSEEAARMSSIQHQQHPVLETQHTTCHVTTEQLVATAEATVTRVIRGLVTSKEMETRFVTLVDIMAERLNDLKEEVNKLSLRVDDYNKALKLKQLESPPVQTCDTHRNDQAAPPAPLNSSDMRHPKKAIAPNPAIYEPPREVKKSPDAPEKMPDRLELNMYDQPKVEPPKVAKEMTNIADLYEEEEIEKTNYREPEIERFNSSIHTLISESGPKKVFTYYWRIPNIHQILADNRKGITLRSPSFYTHPMGYYLFMAFHSYKETLSISVGITRGEFDAILPWPIPLKTEVSVLDQSTSDGQYDHKSTVWSQLCSDYNGLKSTRVDTECVTYKLAIPQREYRRSNSLIIKFTAYFD